MNPASAPSIQVPLAWLLLLLSAKTSEGNDTIEEEAYLRSEKFVPLELTSYLTREHLSCRGSQYQ
jgi:hypothetical protein